MPACKTVWSRFISHKVGFTWSVIQLIFVPNNERTLTSVYVYFLSQKITIQIFNYAVARNINIIFSLSLFSLLLFLFAISLWLSSFFFFCFFHFAGFRGVFSVSACVLLVDRMLMTCAGEIISYSQIFCIS